MAEATTTDSKPEGLRERKRRMTAQRITDAGISLFITKGYEATTLDDIAEAAGISRRSFFSYFGAKDEILLSLQSGMGEALVTALRAQPMGNRPLEAVRDAIIAVCAGLPAEDMLVIDRLMRQSASVQARKQASYVENEQAIFAVLREKWPDPARETGLRLVAMLSVGAMRLAFEALNREAGARPLSDLLHQTFDALEAEI